MKIECQKEKLLLAVLQAERATGKNLSLPILGALLIEAEDGTLLIRATNLDIGIEVKVPAKVERNGKVAVPGTLLANFLSTMQEDLMIRMESVAQNLCVTGERNSAVIKSFPPDEFPTVPHISEDGIDIPFSTLKDGLRSVWYASSLSDIKPEIASVCVFSEVDNLVFVATDSFRLAEKRIYVGKAWNEIPQILIPYKNSVEMVRAFDSVEGEAVVQFNKNQIACSTGNGNIYFTSRIVGGVFPNYKMIIPMHRKTLVVVSKKELSAALKRATLFSNSFSAVHFRIVPSEPLFEIESKNPDVGESTTRVQCMTEGEDIDITFNVKYILDCFQSILSDSIRMEFNGVGKPVVLRGDGDSTFTYLVMPMNR